MFDVSDPREPRELGAVAPPSPFGITTAAGRVYASAGRAGVRVLDFGPEYVPEPATALLGLAAFATLLLLSPTASGRVQARRRPE